MSITARSIRALRLKSGKVYAELRVEVSGEWPPTAWEILGVYSKHPYAFVDGVRYDLTADEIAEMRRAVNAV